MIPSYVLWVIGVIARRVPGGVTRLRSSGMDVERRVLRKGVDSWEGEMTGRGGTYMVEVQRRTRRDEPVWDLEVLRRHNRVFVELLHYSPHPTLDAALEAAEGYVRGLEPGL